MQTKSLITSLFFLGITSLLFFDHHLSWLIVKGDGRKWIKMVSYLISPGFNAALWPLLFLIQFFRKKGWFLCYITASMGFAYLFMYPLKVIIGRARPFLYYQGSTAAFVPFSFSAKYHSLPSGHAVICMAVFTALSYIFPRKSTVLLIVGLILPLTRVLLGKHFLADILIGEAFGCLVATLFMGRATHIIYQIFGKLLGVSNESSRGS